MTVHVEWIRRAVERQWPDQSPVYCEGYARYLERELADIRKPLDPSLQVWEALAREEEQRAQAPAVSEDE